VFLDRLVTRLCGLCAFEKHAHNGLATALWDCVFLDRLVTRLCGLCAIEKHAHNGLATALWDCVFLYRLVTRLCGLCAITRRKKLAQSPQKQISWWTSAFSA